MAADVLGELDRLLGLLVDGARGGGAVTPSQPPPGPLLGKEGGTRGKLLSTGRAGDAIEAVLASSSRATAVQSLRESAVVEQFRNELTDGLIRVDTAHQLLQLVNTLVTRFF